MRIVSCYLIYSLDGVTESPEKWMEGYFDNEVANYLSEQIGRQNAVLLGRRTYELWASYWPNSETEPFASFINETPKYVVSTNHQELTWENSSLIQGDLASEVAELKEQPGDVIGVHGSSSLVRTLLREGLVDEIRLVMPPVVAGSGGRLFDGYDQKLGMELVEQKRTSSGTLLLTLEPNER